jgi:hypothetical protein
MASWWRRFLGMTESTGQGTQENDSGTGQANGDAGSTSDAATTPPEGKVEAEKHGYASELVAYRVVDNLTLVIANRVQTALENDEDVRILLLDNLEYASGGLALAEINAQTELLEMAFEGRETEHQRLLETAEVPTPTLSATTAMTLLPLAGIASKVPALLEQIPKAVGAIADVFAYFDSNYKVSGREMSISNQALLYSTAGSLAGRKLTAFIPGFYEVKESPLLKALTALARRAAQLKTERDYLAKELPGTKQDILVGVPENGEDTGDAGGENSLGGTDRTSGDTPPTEPPDKERLAKVAKAVRETDAVLLAYEGFRTVWMTTPGPKAEGEVKSATTATTAPAAKPTDSKEPSKLDQALIQETVDRFGVTHLLCLSHFSSGGESTIRERFSVLADREGFMGGAAVGYVLASTKGNILAADTLAQFGIIGGTIKEMAEGHEFENIDYKPDIPHGRYADDS